MFKVQTEKSLKLHSKVPFKTASKEVRSLLRKFSVKENVSVNEGVHMGKEKG